MSRQPLSIRGVAAKPDASLPEGTAVGKQHKPGEKLTRALNRVNSPGRKGAAELNHHAATDQARPTPNEGEGPPKSHFCLNHREQRRFEPAWPRGRCAKRDWGVRPESRRA
ncbi:hypothetical protein PCANC_21655 [Puccinia coronata f. sp. avenae]|uniref:Uncharacterized protein n=1 Tax=Puccinia coronata f. sp. avenae TaxID=200324 RepID=A0A2N5SGV0_9BASI|nr:hypothetical protein PCANC_21655 [Puccinia coronata f. sp. avenae]